MQDRSRNVSAQALGAVLLFAFSLFVPSPAAAQADTTKADACRQMEQNLNNTDPERPGLVQAEILFNQHIAQLQQHLRDEEAALGAIYVQFTGYAIEQLGAPPPPPMIKMLIADLQMMQETRSQLRTAISQHNQIVAEINRLRQQIASACSLRRPNPLPPAAIAPEPTPPPLQGPESQGESCNELQHNLDNNDPERPGLVQAEALFKQKMARLQNDLKNEQVGLQDSVFGDTAIIYSPSLSANAAAQLLQRMRDTSAQLNQVTSLHDQVVAETANLRREVASKCSGAETSAGNSGAAVSAGNSGTVASGGNSGAATSAANSGVISGAANCAGVNAQLANLYSQRSEFGASLKNTETQLARLSQPASEESVRTHIAHLNKDVGDVTRWGSRLDREISQLEDLSNRWSCKRTAATTAAPPKPAPAVPQPSQSPPAGATVNIAGTWWTGAMWSGNAGQAGSQKALMVVTQVGNQANWAGDTPLANSAKGRQVGRCTIAGTVLTCQITDGLPSGPITRQLVADVTATDQRGNATKITWRGGTLDWIRQ